MASKKMVADGNVSELIGKAVDELSLPDRWKYANQWVAFRIYTPPGKVERDGVEYPDVKLRRIEAAGGSVEGCVSELRRRSLDPAEFEFTVLKPPY